MARESRTKRCAKVCTALVGAAALALMMTGCDRHDWENPDYVAEMLEDGTQSQRLMAQDRLNDFDEEQRPQLAAAASTAYMEEPGLRSDIMRQLIEWRIPEAQKAYLEELAEDHTGYARAAGQVLGEAGATEAIPEMVEIFESTQNTDRRVGILRGLSHMPEPGAVDLAAEVLAEDDVDNYPIALHQAACDFVGGLALENPEAVTEEAIEGVVMARFLGDADGQDTAEECGAALQKIGPAAVPNLVELFHEENEDVATILRRYDNPDEGDNFPQNQAKQRAAQHLNLLQAPESVELYMEALQETVETPDYEGRRLLAWGNTEAAVINHMVRGLGEIGAEEAMPLIVELIENTDDGSIFDEDGRWAQIASGRLRRMIYQDGARVLNQIGDRQALSTLQALFEERIDDEALETQAALIARAEDSEQHQAPPPLVERFRPERIAAKSFAYLGTADDRDTLTDWFQSLEETFDEQAELIDEHDIDGEAYLEEVRAYESAFDVMDKCEGEEDEADRAQCFAGFFDDDDEHVRAKAAYELSRLPAEIAGPLVAEHLDTEHLETREILTFVGYRMPTPELAESIDQILEAEEGRSSSEYEADHQRLEYLRAWLVHNLE